MPLAWWLAQSGHHAARAAGPNNARLTLAPIPGTRTLHEPLVVSLAIDESVSTQRSDPGQLRHAQALDLASWIARYSGNPKDRLGAVRFGGLAEGVQPVVAVQARGSLAGIFARSTLAIDPTTTVLTPALTQVEHQLASFPHTRRVAVLFSDFQVDDGRKALDAAFAALRRVSDSIYLVALNGDGRWSTTSARFAGVGAKGTFILRQVGQSNFGSTLASIVVRETGQKMPAS